jgi:hypothetical protein
MKVRIGDIVHYVLTDGHHRPAIVVQVWRPETVNLIVFADGSNDGTFAYSPGFTEWKTSVVLSGKKEPNSWHFAEKE